jgi:hypothetical protein
MGKTRVHTVYKLKDGTRVPGVTTPLGILAKPALIHWAWDLGIQGIDYKKYRDETADIGTLAHYLILCHFRKETPDTSDYSDKQITQAENCLKSFFSWLEQNPLEPILIEEPLVSEMHRFGGTPDLLCRLNGDKCLVDFKTGKGIYPEYFIQLAAYKALIEECTDHKINRCKILRIGRSEGEGFEERDIDSTEKEWEFFLHCLAIYNLKKELKKIGRG